MTYVKATGTGGTLTVPSGVPTGAVLYLWADVATSVSPEPTGMDWWDSNTFSFGGGRTWVTFDPFVHDGRGVYTFTGDATAASVGVFVTGVDVDGHGLTNYGNSEIGIPCGFASSTAGVAQKRGDGIDRANDPMFWDYFGNPEATIATPWLLLAAWSAGDQSGDQILFGVDVLPVLGNVEQVAGDPENDWEVTYTKPWPGNVSNGDDYDWVCEGWIVNVSRVPPLRQNQRDDIRQGQRTSRQLTVRQVGYL